MKIVREVSVAPDELPMVLLKSYLCWSIKLTISGFSQVGCGDDRTEVNRICMIVIVYLLNWSVCGVYVSHLRTTYHRAHTVMESHGISVEICQTSLQSKNF